MASTPPSASVLAPAPPDTPPHTPKAAPSCPAVASIIALFRQYSTARPTHDVRRNNITHAALTSALEFLRTREPTTWKWLRHELRWDYSPRTNTLCIRMSPTPFHESIREDLQREIEERMRNAIQNCEQLPEGTREEVLTLWQREVRRTGSADIKFGELAEGAVLSTGGQLSPDASWRFRKPENPVAVVEVAWCETERHWKEKCADYIEASALSTLRTVIGVKCDYSDSDMSTPRTRILLDRRYEDGEEYGVKRWGPNDSSEDHTMRLRLIDFVPLPTAQREPHLQQWSDAVGDITLPFALFQEIVGRANDMRQPSAAPVEASSGPRLGKRKRVDSEDRDEVPTTEDPDTDEDPAPTTATGSFESAEGDSSSDPEYRPSGSSAATRPIATTKSAVSARYHNKKTKMEAEEKHG